jgi:hypothetical protein
MHYEYADQCCEVSADASAETFHHPDHLAASLVNTVGSAQQRIDELEKELYLTRLLQAAANAGLQSLEGERDVPIKKIDGVRC